MTSRIALVSLTQKILLKALTMQRICPSREYDALCAGFAYAYPQQMSHERLNFASVAAMRLDALNLVEYLGRDEIIFDMPARERQR